MEYLNGATEEELYQIQDKFKKTMNICKQIFGKFAFRRLNTEARRGPVNKALFETWSIIIYKMNDSDVQKLIDKRKELCEEFTVLCDDYSFQNAIRAADKTSVKTRISKIGKLVEKILDIGDEV